MVSSWTTNEEDLKLNNLFDFPSDVVDVTYLVNPSFSVHQLTSEMIQCNKSTSKKINIRRCRHDLARK